MKVMRGRDLSNASTCAVPPIATPPSGSMIFKNCIYNLYPTGNCGKKSCVGTLHHTSLETVTRISTMLACIKYKKTNKKKNNRFIQLMIVKFYN